MNNVAYLKRECPFYDLFDNGLCPIKNILLPVKADLEGCTETEVYMVDLEKVGEMRVEEIARRLAAKAGMHFGPVLAEIKARGLPLRVSQTNGCSSDVPFFL